MLECDDNEPENVYVNGVNICGVEFGEEEYDGEQELSDDMHD